MNNKKKEYMKTIKYISVFVMMLCAMTSCMNNFDAPDLENPPYGNNSIGESNTTIADLKTKYSSVIQSNGYEQIVDDVIIEGVVVANDVTGNVYKQLVINDKTGAIIIGINDVGMYAVLPVGQRVRMNCKGLYIGGYGSLAQLGTKYYNTKYSEFQIGRMSKTDFQSHIRVVGKVDSTQEELIPFEVTEEFLADKNNKALAPIYVVLKNVSIDEADGERKYAPEEEQISDTNTAVERNVYVGSQKVIFRLSTYADFANDKMPVGKFDITGVLTRYRNPGSNSDSKDYWQFMLTSTDDMVPVTE